MWQLKAEILRLKQLAWFYLTALLLESVIAGWLLSDYNVSWLTWAGTEAVTVHLAWVGFDAVALAIVWIIGLVWAGAFSLAWLKSIPWAGISVWAASLSVMWFLGLALVLTLAQAETIMRFIGLRKTQAFWILIAITWIGLALGRLAENIFLSSVSS